MTETLRERVRERLARIIDPEAWRRLDFERTQFPADPSARFLESAYIAGSLAKADAILREFRLQPVAVGKVTGEGEVEGL